ncbi:MAG: hypothetical protein LBR08_01175, partial [Bacteroidales bacterium]|nr:hypothetical protein [Bacteroidales bacterium]
MKQPANENAGILYRIEKTDLFEKLVSGDTGKAAGIKAIIDRHVRDILAKETGEDENDSGEY